MNYKQIDGLKQSQTTSTLREKPKRKNHGRERIHYNIRGLQ